MESRRFEVAMLRALGYPHGIVFTATLLEGLLLGAAGVWPGPRPPTLA